jgi:hypothetical protein
MFFISIGEFEADSKVFGYALEPPQTVKTKLAQKTKEPIANIYSWFPICPIGRFGPIWVLPNSLRVNRAFGIPRSKAYASFSLAFGWLMRAGA